MHLTLLHVPNLGVEVSFIVEAIFIFGLSSFWEVGRSECGAAQLRLSFIILLS